MLFTLGPAIAIAELGGDGIWILTLQGGAIGVMAGSMAAARLRTRRPILLGNLAVAI
ncbi:hypothetical protein [Nonomuraea sp. B19D2]|uniref:hypothetical protein n=1 Tax=Nonomuraea sp. B19D2 TaxID=3159561 RepID=UPI0032DBF294